MVWHLSLPLMNSFNKSEAATFPMQAVLPALSSQINSSLTIIYDVLQSFTTLVNNALRVAAINSVGDFVLFLGKIGVMSATAAVGLLWFKVCLSNGVFSTHWQNDFSMQLIFKIILCLQFIFIIIFLCG